MIGQRGHELVALDNQIRRSKHNTPNSTLVKAQMERTLHQIRFREQVSSEMAEEGMVSTD